MKHTIRVLVTGLLAVAATGCVRFADISKAMTRHKIRDLERRYEQFNGTYRIAIPDTIEINIRDHPDLSGTHDVRPDGNISFHYLGDVYVEGFTPIGLAQDLVKRLDPYVAKAAPVVTIRRAASKAYYIFSRADDNGRRMFFNGDVTVLDALAANGGWRRIEAHSSRIRLIRNNPLGREVYRIRADRIVRGDLTTNVLLKEGDILYIPATPLAEFTYIIELITRPIRAVVSGAREVGAAPFALEQGRYDTQYGSTRDRDRF